MLRGSNFVILYYRTPFQIHNLEFVCRCHGCQSWRILMVTGLLKWACCVLAIHFPISCHTCHKCQGNICIKCITFISTVITQLFPSLWFWKWISLTTFLLFSLWHVEVTLEVSSLFVCLYHAWWNQMWLHIDSSVLSKFLWLACTLNLVHFALQWSGEFLWNLWWNRTRFNETHDRTESKNGMASALEKCMESELLSCWALSAEWADRKFQSYAKSYLLCQT